MNVQVKNRPCWYCEAKGKATYYVLNREDKLEFDEIIEDCWFCRGKGVVSVDLEIEEDDMAKITEALCFITGIMPIYGFNHCDGGPVDSFP